MSIEQLIKQIENELRQGGDLNDEQKEMIGAVSKICELCREQHEALVEYRNDRSILERTVGDLIDKYKAMQK